jgi:hypothetical protein
VGVGEIMIKIQFDEGREVKCKTLKGAKKKIEKELSDLYSLDAYIEDEDTGEQYYAVWEIKKLAKS